MTPRDREHFLTLLDALCDERLDEAGHAQLEERVATDGEARTLYIDYLLLHGCLHWDAVEGGAVALPGTLAALQDDSALSRPALPAPVASGRAPGRRRWAFAGVACALLAACALWLRNGEGPQQLAGPPEGRPEGANELEAPPGGDADDDSALPRVRLRDPAATGIASTTGDDPAPGPAVPRGDLVAFIDDRLAAAWTEAGVQPSPEAADSEWLRRVHLDLAGRIPDAATVEAFLQDKNPRKRAAVVERLLNEPTFATHFATVWSNLLVGRAPERDIDRDALVQFLRDQFHRNRPWSETVGELVAAEGADHENGAANFLLAHLNNEAVPATAVTFRILLCQQVQCSQCHVHPVVKDWGQEKFWQLNAFFQQTDVVEREGRDADGGSRMVRELVSRPVGDPSYYETLGGVMRVAWPKFEGQAIEEGPEVNRRRELARLMSSGDRPQLAAAFVNRLWAQLFGRGFTAPVDDMGPHNPPTHPEILDALTEEFVQSDYDIRALVRQLCSTRLYHLSSRIIPDNEADAPDRGERPLFARMYVKPLTAEQLFDSLLATTTADRSGVGSWSEVVERRKHWLSQFYSVLDNEENGETSTFDGSLPQALVMMNGELVQEAVSGRPGTYLNAVLSASVSETEKLRRLCLSTLSREPTPLELAAFRQAVRQATRMRGAAVQSATSESLADAYWAYLNSTEFLVNR
ncbi:MAG: DUF1553 domain-containing protein [Planctomyces sp.]|nr:DUF1553 domain-containing protein [Planctomyces sp.]